MAVIVANDAANGPQSITSNPTPDVRAPRIRVCLVGPSPDLVGGQSVQLQRLLQRLREVPDIEVSFAPVNPTLPRPIRFLLRVRYVRTLATSVAYVISLLRNIRHVDVVHAYSAAYWSFLLAPLPAMLVGRLYGKAVILNYHSGEADDHLRRWRRTAVPAMRLAHAIIVPSRYLAQVFASHGLTAHPVGNFVEAERIPYRHRERPEPIFLSNRNLEPLYNVACTLHAFSRIQREIPHSRLLVAGYGSQRKTLEALSAELGLRHVEFLGRLSPEDMLAMYDAADVYLNSSNIDNMPLSILEAFAAGLPVATTDAEGIPFFVTHERTALVVPRGDDAALANAALRLVRERGLAARLAAAARDECLTKYVWPAVRAEWTRVYRDARLHERARGV